MIPKLTCGVRAAPKGERINKPELDAALKIWELKHGIVPCRPWKQVRFDFAKNNNQRKKEEHATTRK